MYNKILALTFSNTQIVELDNKRVSDNPVMKTDLFADLLLQLDANKVNDQRTYLTDQRYLAINNTNSRAAKVVEVSKK